MSAIHSALHADQLKFAGRPQEAVAIFSELLERDPGGMVFGFLSYQDALAQIGRYEEAYAVAKTRLTIFRDIEADQILELGYGEGGYPGAMLRLAELLEARANDRYIDPQEIASAFGYGGNPEKAIEWIQRAYESRSPSMLYLAVHPYSDAVRSDPRFIDLLQRLDLPQL